MVACLIDYAIDRDRDTPWTLRCFLTATQVAAAIGAGVLFVLWPQMRRLRNPEPYTYSFRVDPPKGHELEDIGMAEKALREMARMSGGQFYREEDLYRLPDDIPPRTVAYRDRQDVMLFQIGLILFVVLITMEWLVRKFSNLS